MLEVRTKRQVPNGAAYSSDGRGYFLSLQTKDSIFSRQQHLVTSLSSKDDGFFEFFDDVIVGFRNLVLQKEPINREEN